MAFGGDSWMLAERIAAQAWITSHLYPAALGCGRGVGALFVLGVSAAVSGVSSPHRVGVGHAVLGGRS